MENESDIKEVMKVIKKLKLLEVCKKAKENDPDDPFEPFPEDLDYIMKMGTKMLNQYIKFLEEFNTGGLAFVSEDERGEKEVWVIPPNFNMGMYAHAYRHDLDDIKIKAMREKGISYREIGRQMGCSPSTARNRFEKMRHKGF